MGKVYEYLKSVILKHKAGFLLLVDPDRISKNKIEWIGGVADEAGVDAILVGGSLLLLDAFERAIKLLKKKCSIPVILFPGSASQVSPEADAIFFLSLVSGRNPTYLIDKHVRGAPVIKKFGIEAIPVGYILVESGKISSVEFMSNTKPIPRDKFDIAMAHSLAAEYLGMKAVYLEAGSGAKNSVPEKMVRAVRNYISIPLIVGGGIKKPEEAREKVIAGASFVVIGTALENVDNKKQFKRFSEAIHRQ